MLASDVAWFPVLSASVRGSVGLCEIGGVYQWTRIGGEVRCGLWQQRLKDPLSVALSGALALDWGPYVGPFGRIGLDVSRSFGPIAPMIDVYVSTGDALRYMEDPADPPIEGPLPGSKSIVRREVRATIPIGLGIRTARLGSDADAERDRRWVWIVIGASPWFLLGARPCEVDPGAACRVKSWDGDHGVVFSLGIEIR